MKLTNEHFITAMLLGFIALALYMALTDHTKPVTLSTPIYTVLATPALANTVTPTPTPAVKKPLKASIAPTPVPAPTAKQSNTQITASARAVVSGMNKERAKKGLPALTVNAQLIDAANAKNADMRARGYWQHFAPDGTAWYTFITKAGYNYSVAGENLAIEFSAPEQVVIGWMGSPDHRANVLNTEYTEVGVSYQFGTYTVEGKKVQAISVVAEFGNK